MQYLLHREKELQKASRRREAAVRIETELEEWRKELEHFRGEVGKGRGNQSTRWRRERGGRELVVVFFLRARKELQKLLRGQTGRGCGEHGLRGRDTPRSTHRP